MSAPVRQKPSRKSSRQRPPSRRTKAFAEERRLPLSDTARDAFVRDLQADSEPNAAAKAGAQRYKKSRA